MKKFVTPAALALSALVAHSDPVVRVDDPWVRTTVPEQTATGAYMTITSSAGGKLVSVTSPVASAVEVHEMKMDGDVMRMRTVDALALPKAQKVELKPGAYHLMLLGLKHPVNSGDVIPLALVVQDADGKSRIVEVSAPARGPKTNPPKATTMPPPVKTAP